MDKNQIQKEIVSLYKKNPYLIINAATGIGKGLSVIKCIAESRSKLPWLICVPEIHQIDNFKQEFIKFGYEDLLNQVEIICYASLKSRYKNKAYNLVLNEVQALSAARLLVLKTITSESIIADSATIPDIISERLYELHNNWEVFTLNLEEAIETGVLPTPKIFLIPSTFSNSKELFPYKRFGKIKKVSAALYYQQLTEDIKYFSERHKKQKEPFILNKILSLASQRKRFIAEIKTQKAQEIIEQLRKQNKKFIVFCGSIAQCNTLGKKNAIHSKKSDRQNKEILHKFNTGEISEIYTVGMLISGMTLNNLDTGVIIQLDKGEDNESLKAIQQVGRSLRSPNPEIYILYNPLSMDKTYMENAIKALGEQFIIS